MPGFVRPDHERPPRRDRAGRRAVRRGRRRDRQPSGAQGRDAVLDRGAAELHRRGDGASRQRALGLVRRADRRVRRARRRQGDRQGAARHLRLRVRDGDEPAQPDAGARGRHALPHGQPAVQFPELERRQGARDVRRQDRRSRPGARGPALEGRARALTKRTVPMDVLVLIDKLDDLVHNAKPVPLTDQVRVDKEEIYDILDQMRATIPEEIKQARWIVKERQEMLAEAKREAERILKEARERQTQLTSEEEITRQAERAAEDIVEDARAREREIRLGAEDYADEILNTLDTNLSKFIAAVQRGRERLQGKDEAAEVA